MRFPGEWFDRLQAGVSEEPILGLLLGACLVAMATTPLAFALMGRTKWFEARRGRTMLRPSFWSLVCSMILVMAIPAIVLLLALKSRTYDRDRYEFDPNQTLSVLDQGRQYRTLKEADEGVRAERKRLEEERKQLVDQVKALDEAMLQVRAAAMQNPAVAPSVRGALERIAALHRSIGLDAPQQLLEEMGTPVALAGVVPAPGAVVMLPAAVPSVAAAAATTGPGAGLTPAQRELELGAVPAAQRTLAGLMPLTGLPAGWELGELGGKHLETFNAENMYEKINGRAESFIQYDVRGMAYANYHPSGDDSLEAQLYIFEMANALKSFGKYSSEKPEEVEPLAVGSEGYTTAGSVFFYSGKYYVQVVTTSDDAKLAGFAKELAQRVAGAIEGKPVPAPAPGPGPAEAVVAAAGSSAGAAEALDMSEASPELFFKLLPAGPKRTGEKYVAQDVFGYSFLTDVFLADYQEGDVTFQGFLRPYADETAAAEAIERYVSAVKEFGAEVKELEIEGAKRAVRSTLDGLVDVVFQKGNTVAGANGATKGEAAEQFATSFADVLPEKLPALPDSPAGETAGEGGTEP